MSIREWLGSRVVSVLDSGAEGPGFKSQPSGNSLRQTVHTHRASVHQAAKLVAALLRVARVTAGLAESNGSVPPGLWLTSPAGWLPRTGISSGTLRSAVKYALPCLRSQTILCLCLSSMSECTWRWKIAPLFRWRSWIVLSSRSPARRAVISTAATRTDAATNHWRRRSKATLRGRRWDEKKKKVDLKRAGGWRNWVRSRIHE